MQRHGRFQYLAQTDYLNSAKEGKNLRGKDIVVTEAATTKAIAFTAAKTAGGSAINTATATTGGALAANTYYYICGAVTAHGESQTSSEKTVVISGGNNATSITFNAITDDGYKRHVYRGTASGVYDGYYELPLNSDATFLDVGGAFDGLKGNSLVDDTSMIEPDADYAVIVTPNWSTTTFVTAKATTGFTINFGTAAPASATVDWFIVR